MLMDSTLISTTASLSPDARLEQQKTQQEHSAIGCVSSVLRISSLYLGESGLEGCIGCSLYPPERVGVRGILGF